MTLLPALIPTGDADSGPPPTPGDLTITALARLDPLSKIPEILLTVTNNGLFNLVGLTDASFERGTGSAVPTNCTISSSTDESLDGTHSLKMVCQETGPGQMSVRLGPYAIQPDIDYFITANVRGGTARTIEVASEYYAGDSFLGDGALISQVDSDTTWWSPTPFSDAMSPVLADSMYLTVTVLAAVGPLSVPTAPTVTPTGTTGSSVYGYVVTSRNAYGETTQSATTKTTTGNATLGGGNYNALSWSADADATESVIYRGVPGDYGDLPDFFPTYADLWSMVPTYADLITYVGEFDFVATVAAPTTTYHDAIPGPLSPPTPPRGNTTGEPAFVDEVGIFPGPVTEWFITPAGSVAIVRSDGLYVLGASPLFPLEFKGGLVATIRDFTAPYGVPVHYVAELSVPA